MARGDNNRKLTPELVREIRKAYVPHKVGYRKLSKMYDVEMSTLRDVVKRRTWDWVN